jgi:hypothetical protein
MPRENEAGTGSDGRSTRSSTENQPTSAAGVNQTQPEAGRANPARTTQSEAGPAVAGSADAIELLKADHRKVEGLFSQYEQAAGSQKAQIVRQICVELSIHTILEEEIFYPACRQAAKDEEPLDQAQVEHDSAKMLIADLMQGEADDPYRDAKVKVLAEQIKHHVGEEEAPGQGIFAKAQAAGVDKPELGQRLQARKQQLQQRSDELGPSRPVSFRRQPQFSKSPQEQMMARQQGDNHRDERGRFMSDDDHLSSRRYGASRGERPDYDDDRRYASPRGRDDDNGRGRFGDPEGRSEASRRGSDERRSFASNRDDDDDGRYARGRYDHDERPGWRGDAEGHAEAARRGWETRHESYGGRSRDEDEDDRRYRSRGRHDEDDRGRSMSVGRDEEGRFTSRRGRDDYDDDRSGRGQGGWFGDPEGHSEASRRGWEERSEYRGRSREDDDDGRRSYRSRGRDDDDDGRGGRGWSGDPRGHSEAARRGWETRR